jgi:hypothetical protein
MVNVGGFEAVAESLVMLVEVDRPLKFGAEMLLIVGGGTTYSNPLVTVVDPPCAVTTTLYCPSGRLGAVTVRVWGLDEVLSTHAVTAVPPMVTPLGHTVPSRLLPEITTPDRVVF